MICVGRRADSAVVSAPHRSPTTTTDTRQLGAALREVPQQIGVGGVPGAE